WLTGAHGKTLVRQAELYRAENSGSGGDSREKASRGSVQIEVWQDFLHASEALSVFRLLYARCVTACPFLLCFLGVGATPSRRLACGCPPLVSQDAECDFVLCVLLVVVLSRSPWSPFSTSRSGVGEKPVVDQTFIMAPRRRRERRVVVQTSQQEAGDAPPPPLAQPRPQDTHGGVVPPLPPQATQGFDWTPQLVGGLRPEHWKVGAAQAQPGPSRQVQQQTGSQPDSRVQRRFRRSRRLTEQRPLPVESVQ
ncbi:hypothetical protein Taro_023596, partial [Colocasia esculenta]|nr:hypothetical protein [Colocasia esculenta]